MLQDLQLLALSGGGSRRNPLELLKGLNQNQADVAGKGNTYFQANQTRSERMAAGFTRLDTQEAVELFNRIIRELYSINMAELAGSAYAHIWNMTLGPRPDYTDELLQAAGLDPANSDYFMIWHNQTGVIILSEGSGPSAFIPYDADKKVFDFLLNPEIKAVIDTWDKEYADSLRYECGRLIGEILDAMERYYNIKPDPEAKWH